MSKVLLISNDVIGMQMAGPGIRTWELAKLLATEHTVTLLTPTRTDLQHPRISTQVSTQDCVRACADMHDVVIGQGQILSRYPFLLGHSIVKVVDLYDPSPVGYLETTQPHTIKGQLESHHALVREHYNYLRAGDVFLCASERQWDFWAGMLMAAGRINPVVYRSDRMLRSLLIVAPFGVPARAPGHRRRVLKGVWPGIDPDDVVLLWGGGLWEWFDPMMAVEAMSIVGRRRTDIKLFFMGVKRPNASVTTSHTADQTIALAEQLGVANRLVFFNDWVAYEDRENFLLEADLGLNIHRDNLETRFSFRTRMMDYFWAGLPIITTEGDPLSDLVKQNQLGLTVPCGDAEALAHAILRAADDQATRQTWKLNCLATAKEFSWDRVFEPVVAWCRSPIQARDKEYTDVWNSCVGDSGSWPKHAWEYYLQRALHHYRVTGMRGLATRVISWSCGR
ncbi:MAG: glycosyltransferase family 4 protein [Nitrospira sp.]|uniref:glycosyltransferase family 4 protein n=1 Tax=Nitrospira sp. ND1 TaxID=1658518 RepID=UPI0009BABB0E|nr:glycosyltransferase family 4 protein [Nitrospira sp. ND1]MBK7420929.1 glycosyltransferase family 4 protein [Nitrospira sp.]OYT25161.1 MAG: glycosyl transferase family 1 [Nitrospira sp. UW-LDO-02]MBP6206038.1 glycosyltransferase family 4 protein [Nitrospira sp.]MBP8104273.1 glycosyltransferase family 4 protein [Nitrospira sp.]MBP8826071.1 glycosyltransferase family 4 protein [Nitrospira sp.]